MSAEKISSATVEAEKKPVQKVITQVKRFLTRERSPDDPFSNYLDFLDSAEKKSQEQIQDESKRLYELWAGKFNILKREFWLVWDLFLEIEESVEGWHIESPNLAQWGPVGLDYNGYTFGACAVKNFKRNAPLPEKSVVVTFGIVNTGSGIGDERLIGRPSPIDDTLVGFEGCRGKTIVEQYKGSRRMIELLKQHQLRFRLSHREHGQKTAAVDLKDLKKDSLYKICQALFAGLNSDIMPDLESELPSGSAPLLLK